MSVESDAAPGCLLGKQSIIGGFRPCMEEILACLRGPQMFDLAFFFLDMSLSHPACGAGEDGRTTETSPTVLPDLCSTSQK